MVINGKLVRELRQHARLSSLELAQGICSDEMLFQIEENRANPSDELVNKIADKLGVSVAALQSE